MRDKWPSFCIRFDAYKHNDNFKYLTEAVGKVREPLGFPAGKTCRSVNDPSDISKTA